jgi:hypothetical protein
VQARNISQQPLNIHYAALLPAFSKKESVVNASVSAATPALERSRRFDEICFAVVSFFVFCFGSSMIDKKQRKNTY